MTHPITKTEHTFQIPVMGTGYTADTPIKVAKYGIASVLSLVDDILLEQLHKHHSEQRGLAFSPVDKKDTEARAIRIERYLNFLDSAISEDIKKMKEEEFTPDSEITKYFEMLPDCLLKDKYNQMLSETDTQIKAGFQQELKSQIVPGNIEVNIMTKIDRATDSAGDMRPKELSDAMSALRGFAKSTVNGSLVLSAGLNPKLYGYISKFEGFFPDKDGSINKKIVLKVSDYRSAFIQSKFFARNGLWLSEFRIESSLNCGGHAFPTEGLLLGPILEEFKKNRETIINTVSPSFLKALKTKNITVPDKLPPQIITVQGGIGTSEEDSFLRTRYNLEGTGWATPFLVVPEATNVDDEHLKKLCDADDSNVYLSDSSPLQVPFWMLKNSTSELLRLDKIAKNRPGAPCKKGYLVSSIEFSKQQLCLASSRYQREKLVKIDNSDMTPAQKAKAREITLAKACICHDLGGGATIKNCIDLKATPTVCTGPNIVNFSEPVSLKDMVDHIYGRKSISLPANRPHVFIREISLYFDALKKQFDEFKIDFGNHKASYFEKFIANLQKGFDYYKDIAQELPKKTSVSFLKELEQKQQEFDLLKIEILPD